MKKDLLLNNGTTDNDNIVDVLIAISVVSKRLAKNLVAVSKISQSEKGERRYEQNEQYGYGNRRVKKRCCHY